ncbi:hypothetical protein BRADI_5g15352v3 [Brachypodium distachyon]|uniref:Uncharacterized protein n=1 Tax=Brachypodium distachyon TaxID=15368 RepID=A0A2K2CHE0_BRADI|nr:hypothetical protein BRADI_5g15352v3 [Brachypodium distachyon]
MYFYTEPAHLFFIFFFAGKNQRRPQGHNKGSPNVTSNFRGEPTQSDLSSIDRSPQGFCSERTQYMRQHLCSYLPLN